MVNFNALKEKKKLELSHSQIDEILDYLKKVGEPKTPLKNHEIIVIKETVLCCLVLDYTCRCQQNSDRLDSLLIEMVKKGYMILTVWNEFNPKLPLTIFVWHPHGQSEYSKLIAHS